MRSQRRRMASRDTPSWAPMAPNVECLESCGAPKQHGRRSGERLDVSRRVPERVPDERRSPALSAEVREGRGKDLRHQTSISPVTAAVINACLRSRRSAICAVRVSTMASMRRRRDHTHSTRRCCSSIGGTGTRIDSMSGM